MGKEEAEGVVACTGHIITDILPLLIIDIATTEFCLSPNFSDEEVHDVATTILDSWSDDAAVRQKIALDAIVEYRRPESGWIKSLLTTWGEGVGGKTTPRMPRGHACWNLLRNGTGQIRR